MKRRTLIKLVKARRSSINVLRKVIGMIIGALLVAVSYNALIVPYGLLSGGIGGLSLIGKYVLDIPLYIGIFVLNIPVFAWGLKELDRKLILYSLIGTLVTIIAIPALKPFIPVPSLDLFLAALFSGIVSGVGGGIFFKVGASAGGTDIISMVMKKKKNISIGVVTFYCNMGVLAFSLLFFDLKIALYTAVSMWVSGKVTDAVIEGLNKNKSVMIISEKSEEIARKIIKDVHRGVTFLEGQGAFSGNNKKVINCVVSHFEIAKVKEVVFEIDAKAFIFFTETAEVVGKGFTR